MATATLKLITPEEFEAMPESRDHELVRGELVPTMPSNPEHGRVVGRTFRKLDEFVQSKAMGEVYVDVGFWLPTDPPGVRGPDVAFVRKERLPAQRQSKGFYRFVPDLAVEVVSPDDKVTDLEAKIQDYVDGGVALLWIVLPATRRVRVYREGRLQGEFGSEDALEAEPALPGFRVSVRELFG